MTGDAGVLEEVFDTNAGETDNSITVTGNTNYRDNPMVFTATAVGTTVITFAPSGTSSERDAWHETSFKFRAAVHEPTVKPTELNMDETYGGRGQVAHHPNRLGE